MHYPLVWISVPFRRTAAAWLAILSVMVGGLTAQAPIYLEPAKSENRLSENATRDILEDSRGMIWVATIDGLNRFDGYRFHTYRTRANDTTGVSDNYISTLYEDRAGNLWVGTYHGLNRYLPSCDCFERYLGTSNGESAPGTVITAIAEDAGGRLWVSAYNGLSYRDSGGVNFTPIQSGPATIQEAAVTALHPSADGSLWVGYANRGISRYAAGAWSHLYSNDSIGEVKGIAELDPDRLLLATRTGAYLADLESQSLIRVADGHFAGLQWVDGTIYVRSYFKGIYAWQSESETLSPVPVYYAGKQIFGDVHIYLKDSHGITWGAYQGLAKSDPFEKRFHQISPPGQGENDLLPSPEVVGIQGDAAGGLVVAMQYNGLIRLSGEQGNWSVSPIKGNDLADVVLWRFPYLHRDVAWLGGINGLYRYDLNDGALTRFPEGQDVKTMLRDAKGRTWYVDKLRGVGRFQDGQRLASPYQDFGELRPIDIKEDSAGNIWVLASEYVFRYRESTDRFERIAQVTPPIPRDDEHRSFLLGRGGDIWVASIDGLYRYRFQDSAFTIYDESSGLANSRVSSLLEGPEGLWIGTNLGLSFYDYARDAFFNYDVNDGLINTIHLPEAAYRDADGFLYFGGINGIDYFHPDSLSGQDPHPPSPLLERVLVHNPWKDDPGMILWPQADDANVIELSYHSLPLQFDLLALGYTQTRENRFAFKMDGVDDSWIDAGANRSTIYSYLPRGKDLSFRVKAASHDGVWSPPVTYRLYIRPPFWETLWFRLTLIGLGILSLVVAYRYRLRQIRRRNRYLEAEVERKTRQVARQAERLAEVNGNLREQANLIKTKARQLNQLNVAQSSLFTNLSHEFRTLLTLMVGYLEEVAIADRPERVLPALLDRMRMNAGEMLHLVDQLMDTARLESGQYPLYVTTGNIRGECKNVIHGFHIFADRAGVQLTLSVDEHVPEVVWFDRDVVYKVLTNLLANAIKFTPPSGLVHNHLSVVDDHIVLRVSDTGMGIPEDALPKIFDRFHQVKQADGKMNGTGIGLALVRKLVKRHQGDIKVTSEVGVGTEFTVTLPCTSAAYPAGEIQPPRISGYLPPTLSGVPSEKGGTPATEDAGRSEGPATELEILVVEDNTEARELLCRQLRPDYTVVEAANGREGLEKALEVVPDLILTDRLMPEMDGLSLCRAIRSDSRISHIPVIMLTAMTTRQQKMEGLGSGADLYLQKPFDRRELALLIQKQFEARERVRQHFLKNVSTEDVPAELNEGDQAFLRQLTAYVDAELEKDIDLTDLSRSLGVSRTQLFRKMKALVGMSVTEFIRDYRLRRAFQLLQAGELRIGEIIQATGFNSRSYFYRSFKEKFGCRPTELKRPETTANGPQE